MVSFMKLTDLFRRSASTSSHVYDCILTGGLRVFLKCLIFFFLFSFSGFLRACTPKNDWSKEKKKKKSESKRKKNVKRRRSSTEK